MTGPHDHVLCSHANKSITPIQHLILPYPCRKQITEVLKTNLQLRVQHLCTIYLGPYCIRREYSLLLRFLRTLPLHRYAREFGEKGTVTNVYKKAHIKFSVTLRLILYFWSPLALDDTSDWATFMRLVPMADYDASTDDGSEDSNDITERGSLTHVPHWHHVLALYFFSEILSTS